MFTTSAISLRITIQGKLKPCTLRGNIIYDGAGGDCTAMWFSYHPVGIIKSNILEKFKIGRVRDYNAFYTYNNNFLIEVKDTAEKMVPKSKRCNHYKLFLKGLIIVPSYLYFLYQYTNTPNLFNAILLGLFAS